MRDDQLKAIRQRIEDYKQEHPTPAAAGTETEDVNVINKRQFQGGDLSDIAARMYRY